MSGLRYVVRDGQRVHLTCKNGHPFTPENTYVVGVKLGAPKQNRCRTCWRTYNNAFQNERRTMLRAVRREKTA